MFDKIGANNFYFQKKINFYLYITKIKNNHYGKIKLRCKVTLKKT